MIRRLPWELLALPALAVARLLPADGAGLALRLAAATACLLVPGMLIARALGHPSASAALAWSLAGLLGASAVMFAVGGSLRLTLGLYAAVGAGAVLLHEATVLTPLAFLVAYEAGAAAFRSAWGGLAALFPQVALIALAPGRGGAYTALALPATAARQLLVTAVIALFFCHVAEPSWRAVATLAAGELGLAVVHPTYAIFVAIPLAAYVAARFLLARCELARGAVGLAAIVVPAGLFGLWLLPLVRETASHNPSPAEELRGLKHYAGQVDVFSVHRFRLAPEVFGRTGAVAVAALLLVPLAALAARRRWAAFVLGGSALVLGLELVPLLFTRFSDAVSLSQARRAAGFLPFAFALAGGAFVGTRLVRLLVLPVALAAGILLQHLYPGDFSYGGAGGPAWAAWIALFGALVALVAAAVSPWQLRLDRAGPVAATASALFVLPVAVAGLSPWSSSRTATKELTPGLIHALRTDVPRGAIVFSDDTTSYRIAAWAPVYVANALPGHVADTTANRPYERREDSRRFFKTADLSIPRRYHAGYLVVNTARNKLKFDLPRLYGDDHYSLYRL